MGHLGHLKAEYQDLVTRLDSNPVGMPFPTTDHARKGWQEILEILYTTEEAALGAKLPLMPASLERIAKKTGIAAPDLKMRLDAMADKGLVMDLIHPKTKKVKYMLSPPVVGFFEFSLMRAKDMIPKKRIAEALDAYCHGDAAFASEVFGGDTVIGRTMVNEDMLGQESMPDILDWERATHLLKEARNIAVALCYCRHKQEHLGKACDAPVDNCLSINAGADFVERRNFGRKIDAMEALDILVRSRESGLVQIADNVQNRPSFICNCCGCCCGQLQAINEYDLHAVNPSNYRHFLDRDKCVGCSKCARACPVTAIFMTATIQTANRKNKIFPAINLERCIGCGVCAQACSSKHALSMKTYTKKTHIPVNAIEKSVRMSLERGRLADLIFDQGEGRGSRFLNKVVKSITNLSPIEKVLASEQLRSRFINYVLKTVKDPTEG